MKRGIVRVQFTAGAAASAPTSGVQIGMGESGPVSVRLFRLSGTRVALPSAMSAAQLIAIRTAAGGTPVQVVTSRPQFWEPLIRHDRGAHVVSAAELLQPPGGPSLLVDDRPAQVRGGFEINPWQCRLDVRTEWAPSDVPAFAYTDLAVFGGVPAELTDPIAASFGLRPHQTQRLARLEPGSVALLRRGRIEYVVLNPTPAEGRVLDLARGSALATPIWRS